MDRIIKKANYNKSNFITGIATGMIPALCGVFGIIYSTTMENYFGRNDDLKTLFMLGGLLMMFLAIPMTIRAYNYGQNTLCVCEDKLYGKASNANFMKSFAFEMDYSEIVSVNLKSTLLSIEKRNETLYFYVEDAKEVKSLIERKMSEYSVR